MNPMPLTKAGMTLGALTRDSDAAHRATPAPNDGVLAARSMGAVENQRLTGKKDQEAGRHHVVTPAHVMYRKQCGCNDERGPVQAPGKPAPCGRRRERAGHTEDCADDESHRCESKP
jgi:hypothetical protein